MNKLYIDLYLKSDEKEKIASKNKLIRKLKRAIFSLKNLFVNYRAKEFEGNVSIKVDEDFLNLVAMRQNRKYSFEEKKLLKYIKENLGSKSVKVIFSNRLYEKKEGKKYLLKLLNNISDAEFNVQEKKNEMLEHDLEIIKRYTTSCKIKRENVRLLVICSGISDLRADKLKEYIEEFKEVDVLIAEKRSASEINKVKAEIEAINNEYGTSITLVGANKKDIKKYNVYILYSNIDKDKFKDKYIINKKAKYIDINNVDEDYLSSGYKLFVKHEKAIKSDLENLGLNISNFSITVLGNSCG